MLTLTRLMLVSACLLGAALVVMADELPEDTNKITSLTAAEAKRLAETFSGAIAEFESQGIAWKCGGCLPLNGLKKITPDVAQALSGYSKGPLLLNGLTALDADTAKTLAGFKGRRLVLDGLTTLDADTAKAIADFKGDFLHLNGLTALDAATTKALAEFKGNWLYLNGLTTLDAATARVLAKCNAWNGFLPKLTTLDADSAKALAGATEWNGHLSAITALDSPDSVAIAKALSSRNRPLSLPNLKKVSPKTLSALIEKQDVELPLIETLELIPEPDGSPTEDFVIPEWLQARQNQQRQQQAK